MQSRSGSRQSRNGRIKIDRSIHLSSFDDIRQNGIRRQTQIIAVLIFRIKSSSKEIHGIIDIERRTIGRHIGRPCFAKCDGSIELDGLIDVKTSSDIGRSILEFCGNVQIDKLGLTLLLLDTDIVGINGFLKGRHDGVIVGFVALVGS